MQLVAADANGEKVVHSSPASDMWALGVLAYEMFAGYAKHLYYYLHHYLQYYLLYVPWTLTLPPFLYCCCLLVHPLAVTSCHVQCM